jgi:hypothetical protein
MSTRLRITCIIAICASASATIMVFLAGIAAACSGEPPVECKTTPTVTTEAASLVLETSVLLHGQVNPEGCQTNFVFEYGPTEALGFFTVGGSAGSGVGNKSVTDSAIGLSPGTKYYFRISAINSEGKSAKPGTILSFTTTSTKPPVITTEEASDVLTTSATLNGSVNPEGAETTYEFEYGTTTSYEKKSEQGKVASGFGAQKVNKSVAGLAPGTTYHYRIVAKSSHGTATPGADKTFKTSALPGKPPVIATEEATDVLTTSATLNGSVNPEGAETTYEFEYGTSISYGKKSEQGKVAAGFSAQKVNKPLTGLELETTYHYRIVAKNSNGSATPGADKTFTTSSTAWKIKETPNPAGASDSNLYDVSCEPSTSVCTSVGKSTISAVDSPLVQRWNGTSWSEQTAAKKSGSTHNRLFGVDCPSEIRCIAVGNYQNSEGGPATLGELWNESKWVVQTTPVPSEATSSELVAVGCNSTASCRAAGSAVVKSVKTAIVEKWASPTWSLDSIPIPAGATSSQLDGVDCIWSNFCAAVGRYTTSGGSIKSLAMFWNGTEWSLQTLTDPEKAVETTLLDVSCTPTPNRCMAVGGWKNSAKEQFTLAYRFNGTSTWTLQSTPNPPSSIASVFQDASCAAETSCAAAGSWVGGGSNQTLAETWNGSSWSIESSQDPAGATFSAFFGVSCRESSCFGVGWSTNALGVDTTLAEFR